MYVFCNAVFSLNVSLFVLKHCETGNGFSSPLHVKIVINRYIIKSYQAAKRGEVVGPSVAYLVSKDATEIRSDLSDSGKRYT